MRQILFAAFLFFACAAGISGAEPDPLLEDFIRKAVSNHPDLRAMQNMVEAAEARRTMSGSLMNPELTIGLMDLPSDFSYNSDPGTALQVGIMQRLPWKGRLKSAELAAEARVEEGKLGIEVARQNMASMIAMAYYDLAGLEEERVLLKEGLRLAEEMTLAATWMTGSAMGRLSDIERSRLEEENWKLKLIANQGDIVRKRADLAYAVGQPLDTLLFAQIRLPEGLPLVMSIDSLLAPEILDNAPVIREAFAEAAAAKKDLQLARLNWYPDFDVMLSYDIKPDLKSMGGVDHNGQPLPVGTIDQMNMISLGVTFPLPVFSNGNQRAEVAEMTAMYSSAESKIADVRLSLEKEIRQFVASLEEENNCCAFVQETVVGRAQTLYETSLIDYQSGKTPFMELSQARMSLLMAKMELSMSRANAWSIKAKIMAALGSLVPKSSID